MSSVGTFTNLSTASNAGESSSTPFDGEQHNSNNDVSSTSVPSAGASFDAFFGLDGMNGFGFGPAFGQTDAADLDPFSLDHQAAAIAYGMIHGGYSSGSSPFPQLDFPSFGTPPGLEPAAGDQTLNYEPSPALLNMISAPHIDSTGNQGQAGGSESVLMERGLGDACLGANLTQPVWFPTRDLHLLQHIPPASGALDVTHATGTEASDASGPSAAPSEPRVTSSQTHRSRSRKLYTPYPDASQVKKVRERASKGKGKAEKDVWRVVTAPTSAPTPTSDTTQGDSPTPPGNGLAPSEAASSSTDPSLASASAVKKPGRRKEVFQHVDPPKAERPEKPEWYVSPPSKKWDPKPFELPPRENPLPPGTHSDLGWVLARLREPDSERAQYGWAIAQIHNHWDSTYLILSGPHQTKVKQVREYDRMAYSPENIAKLQERVRKRKKEQVHAEVALDTKTIYKLSSLFAIELAAGGKISLPD